jgi:hypothetical protein
MNKEFILIGLYRLNAWIRLQENIRMQIKIENLNVRFLSHFVSEEDIPDWFVDDIIFESPLKIKAALITAIGALDGSEKVFVQLWESSTPKDGQVADLFICFLRKGSDNPNDIFYGYISQDKLFSGPTIDLQAMPESIMPVLFPTGQKPPDHGKSIKGENGDITPGDVAAGKMYAIIGALSGTIIGYLFKRSFVGTAIGLLVGAGLGYFYGLGKRDMKQRSAK